MSSCSLFPLFYFSNIPQQHPTSHINKMGKQSRLTVVNPQAMPEGLLSHADRGVFYNLLAWIFAAQFKDIMLIIRTKQHPPMNTALLVNKLTLKIVLRGPTPDYLIDDSPQTARKKAVNALYDLLRTKTPGDDAGSGYSTDESLEEVLEHDLQDDRSVSSARTDATLACMDDRPTRRDPGGV